MMIEKLVFKIFPQKISYIDKYYYEHENMKSKWFSILVAIDDITLHKTHYFYVESFKPLTKNISVIEAHNG